MENYNGGIVEGTCSRIIYVAVYEICNERHIFRMITKLKPEAHNKQKIKKDLICQLIKLIWRLK